MTAPVPAPSEALPLYDRALLAYAALVRLDQRHRRLGVLTTDSDVLDVVQDWSAGDCPDDRDCADDRTCCDHARLDALVWDLVDATTSDNPHA